jgi:hypothetical protein
MIPITTVDHAMYPTNRAKDLQFMYAGFTKKSMSDVIKVASILIFNLIQMIQAITAALVTKLTITNTDTDTTCGNAMVCAVLSLVLNLHLEYYQT